MWAPILPAKRCYSVSAVSHHLIKPQMGTRNFLLQFNAFRAGEALVLLALALILIAVSVSDGSRARACVVGLNGVFFSL